MLCKDLQVVNLSVTEDFYEYKALFRLCTDDRCLDIDLAELSENKTINNIKEEFGLEETNEEIRKILMEKVMKASKHESRKIEGEDCCKDTKSQDLKGNIDLLNRA